MIFVIEYVIFNFVNTKKLEKGVSQNKLKEFTKDIGISYMLNVEFLLLVDSVNESLKSLISELNIVRKRRNDIVHSGKGVTQEEAIHAFNITKELLNYLNIGKK